MMSSAVSPLTEITHPQTRTVTFLFTDIESSTRLWETYPEAMRTGLIRHDEILHAAVRANGGCVFKTVGDGFYAVFASARNALLAAADAQRALLRVKDWGAIGALRVRMALHTGSADERGGDYFGPTLNRVARLLASGHGEQILLSQTAAEMVQDVLPPGMRLLDLGTRRLKDLLLPERVFQLAGSDLPQQFPPLRSLDALPNNLPQQVTSFVGREQQLEEVKQRLRTQRLLTLAGAGGSGKTRLSLQVGADLVGEFGDGVWLAELAPISDPALVPQIIAAAVGVREEPDRPLRQTLLAFLRDKDLLLILDNCEHLLAACAELADVLLRDCPGLRVLASSREALGIAGENIYRVPSLSLPATPSGIGGEAWSATELERFEAVRLFVERAHAAAPGFALSEANAAAIAGICRRLDGIPLAIELAAARVRALPPDQIARRLDDRFRLLTGGSRTALPRQQTLRALIDWSYDLLDERERSLFRRLSVFAGGWTLEACEAVCAIGDVDEWEILDLLSHLVDKSLVVFDDQGYAETAAEPRYRLSETIRQYGRDRLLESGEGALLRDRHRDFFLRLAEQADACLRGPESARWLHRLEQEHDNLRAALEWSRGAPDGDGLVGLRLAGALARFWETRGYLREGRQHLSDALALPGADAPTEERATALAGAGMLATDQGAHEEAQALYEQSLAIRRARGDRRGVANTLNSQGLLAWNQGYYASAHALCEESLAMWREIGDKRGMAGCLNNLANAAAMQGDRAAARAYYEEALRLNRELGNKTWEAHILNNMGDMANEEGDLARAGSLYRESLALLCDLGDRHAMDSVLESLGVLAMSENDPAAATRAVGLLAAAQALRDAVGTALPLSDRVEFEQHVSRARTLLGEDRFAAAWSEGQRMTLEQAVAYALADENANASA